MKGIRYCIGFVAVLLWQSGVGQAPLTLDESVKIALENSPDVRRARLNLIRSQELLNAALADQKSNFAMEITPYEFFRRREYFAFANQWFTNERVSYGGAFRVDQPILRTDGTLSLVNQLQWQNATTTGETPNKAFTNNLYLSYNQPLFTYNRRKLQLSELETSLENAQINYSVQELNIERSVTQAFYNVYREMESLKISQDEYANQQGNYRIIKDKVEAGLSAREELFQAEVNVANSRSALQNQEVVLDNTKDDFKLLLGLDLYTDVNITANIEAEFVEVDLSFAIDNGLTTRKEIRQREIDIQNAQNDLVETKASNEFRGDLGLTVGIFGEDENFPNIYENPTKNPNVSLTFTIPLYDWGAKKSRIKASEASIEIQELNMSDQRNDIILSVRRSFRSLANLKSQIEIAEQSVRNSQQTYDINQERYTNGDITGLELNQYQNQLSQAKIDLISAKINYQLEMLNMKIQSLWDFKNNQSVISENTDN